MRTKRRQFATADKLAAANLSLQRRVPKMRKCCQTEVGKATEKSEELAANLAKRAEALQTQLESCGGTVRGARSLLDCLDAGRFRRLADRLKLISAALDVEQIIKDVLIDAASTLKVIADNRDAVIEFDAERWLQMSDPEYNRVIRGITT